MNILRARNVHEALLVACQALHDQGVDTDSRNGKVRLAVGPVAMVYEKPCERVVLWPERDANPFFHFYESLWMLGGRNDVESVQRFAGNMANYSDDGKTFHGAYGKRWRGMMPADHHPNGGRSCALDQVTKIIEELKANPLTRRCVLQMWDGLSDLGNPSKDVPCNDTATFQVNPQTSALDLVVFCRSNDIVWGCYGANAVQFSVLLEYVARLSGFKVGTYTQVSVNWHGYDTTFWPLHQKFTWSAQALNQEATTLEPLARVANPYVEAVTTYPLIAPGTTQQEWDRDLYRLLNGFGRAPVEDVWSDPFFREVAVPILRAHDIYKESRDVARFERAINALRFCRAIDWRTACHEWLDRRWNKALKEQDDGISYPEALR